MVNFQRMMHFTKPEEISMSSEKITKSLAFKVFFVVVFFFVSLNIPKKNSV